MATGIQTQEKLANVQQFNCTGCGASLSVLNPRAQYIACQYCGSVLDVNSEEHKILKELGKPDRHRPISFIRLGQEATFNGRTYMVIARTRMRMKYKEYWSEEGESGYSNEVWIFDEWLLIDEYRTYFYLIEDKEGFKVSEEIIPETPMLLPRNLRMSFFKKQSKQIVREYGGSEVIYFEGESNYQIRTGDLVRFAMFTERGIEYSVEWRVDKDGDDIKEIEFFREIPVSRRKVIEAFSNNEEIELLKQKEAKWRFIFRVALFTMIALFALLLYSFINDGKPVYQQDFNIQTLQEETASLSQPIEIKEAGLYKLFLTTPYFTQNSEFYAFGYILDKDSLAINTIDGSFYWYEGYEDGEKWTEKDLSTSKVFRLTEPGTYFIQLYKSGELPGKPVAGTLKVSVNRGVLLSRYFIFAIIICLIPLLIAYNKEGS